MRIKSIAVTKLFGLFDHTIPLNMDDRITIVHGPNGFGKTALLTMVDAVFNGEPSFTELHSIPFEEFKVQLDDGSEVCAVRSVRDEQSRGNGIGLQFRFSQPGFADELYTPPRPQRHGSAWTRYLANLKGTRVDTSEAEWVRDSSVFLNLDRHLLTLVDSDVEAQGSRDTDRPEWLENLRSAVGVRLIQTLRLLKYPRRSKESATRPPVHAIIQYSK